ncbi:CRISPR system precrRNA processing endoribonuclease RAMP protein Cas6 [Candidatus Harpocratesius sp.]
MAMLTQFIFTLYPHESTGPYFLQPYAYIFRGIFMNWLKAFNSTVGDDLHKKQPKDSNLFMLEYALQQELHYAFSSNQNPTTNSSRTHQRNRSHSRRSMVNKIIYKISSLDDSISQALLNFLLQQRDTTIQYAMQKAIIAQVEIRQKSLIDLIKTENRPKSLKIRFLTPTAFSIRGKKTMMRLPLPEYLFPNLAKLWDSIFEETDYQIPDSFFEWVNQHVSISSFQLKTHAWDMGKDIKFTGASGWIKYINDDSDNPLSVWLDVLTRFGEDMNTGNGRTAGFGQFKVINSSN